MKFKGILFGAVLLAVLSGAVYWSINRAADKDKESAKDPPKVLAVLEADMTQLEILKRGEDPVLLKRGPSGGWSIASPKQLRTDADAINQMMQVLANLSPESVIDENIANWDAFGLKEPSVTLRASKKDGKTYTLRIGDDLPAGGSMYVRLNDETKLYSVAGFQRASLSKSWRDLRDRRLLLYDPEKVTKIELNSGKSAIELSKVQASQWQISKPKPYRADSFAIEELARKLRDARLDPALGEADQKKMLSQFNTASPLVTVRTTDPEGVSQMEVRWARNDQDGGNTYYAKSSVVEGAHKLPPDLGSALDKGVDDFREKKLFEFGFADPGKIELKHEGVTRTFTRNLDKWVANGKELKGETIQVFIDRLRELKAAGFLAEPRKIKPEFEVSVSSQDGKKTESVKISGTIAARGDEPAIYQLDAGVVDELRKQADNVEHATDAPAAKAPDSPPAKK